jgi:hypothetical protein
MDVLLYSLLTFSLMLLYIAWNHKKDIPSLIKRIFDKYSLLFRITVAIVLIIIVIGVADYLHDTEKDLPMSDLAKFVVGGLVVVGLFYSILAFEFNVKKTKRDYQTAKEILTFNTANEWHKAPVKDYQVTSIECEYAFQKTKPERTAEELYNYVQSNLEYRETLKGILNYFENLSVGVYKELIDKAFVSEFISYIFEVYYIDYYYFIKIYREKRGNDTIWVNFTNLAEDWFPKLKKEVLEGKKQSTLITINPE